MALFAVFGMGNAFAEDIIWSEDWTGWEAKIVPSEDAKCPQNYTFVGTVTNDDGSFKSGTAIYNENLAGGSAPELLIAKSSGSFTVTISLGSKTGDMFLAFKANNAITVTLEEGSTGTLGTQSKTGNDYVYPITGASGTLIIKIAAGSKNVRLDDIKLYQGDAKKPAGLSWGTSSRDVTIGADDNVFPQLTNENELPITYDSSDKTVATISSSGSITLVAAGKTTISAAFAGNDEYEAQTVTYVLTVKEATQETEKTIAELYDLTAATANIKLKISNGKVVYVNGTSAYVRDGAKAMYFYNTGLDLPLNATVSGTVNVDLDIYKGLHEVKKNSNTNADNLVITASSEEAVPVEATFASLAANNYTNDLIIIKDQSVIEDGGKWYIQSGDTKIQLYKKDADYSQYVSETKKYDITAIATVYNSNAQLTPISFSETTNIQNMTIDTDASAPIYSLDGRRVDQNYRGVVIQNGVKRIQK